MDVRELSKALESAYNTMQVQVQITGVFYEVDRVLILSDLSDRDENSTVILRVRTPNSGN